MSAQFRENLHISGKELGMCSEPLEAYFEANGVRPDIRFNMTALDRGYVGEWEIADGKLYLTGIWGELNGAPGPGDLGDIPALTVEHIFPGSGGRVFAEWFSGALRCEDGKRLRYSHFGYDSLYERDVFLEIECGVLVSERVRENDPPIQTSSDESSIPDFLRRSPVEDEGGGNSTQSEEPTPDGMVPMLSEWSPDVNDEGDGQNDALYDQAVALVIKHQRASPAFLRFRLHVGWERSIHLIKAMQKAGLVAMSRRKT